MKYIKSSWLSAGGCGSAPLQRASCTTRTAHARGDPGSRSTQKGHLPEDRAGYGNRCRPHLEERAAAIGQLAAEGDRVPVATKKGLVLTTGPTGRFRG